MYECFYFGNNTAVTELWQHCVQNENLTTLNFFLHRIVDTAKLDLLWETCEENTEMVVVLIFEFQV